MKTITNELTIRIFPSSAYGELHWEVYDYDVVAEQEFQDIDTLPEPIESGICTESDLQTALKTATDTALEIMSEDNGK